MYPLDQVQFKIVQFTNLRSAYIFSLVLAGKAKRKEILGGLRKGSAKIGSDLRLTIHMASYWIYAKILQPVSIGTFEVLLKHHCI